MFKHNLQHLEKLKRKNVDGARLYLTESGQAYPSVTTITGLAKAEAIKAWRNRVGAEQANKISTQASRMGTKVHKLFEDYVGNVEIDFKKIDPIQLFMFKQLKPILDEYLNEVYAIEAPLYSDFLQSAGTVDLIGVFAGKPSIIDFKTSAKKKKRSYIDNYFMQEAAYATMFRERTGIQVDQLITLICTKDSEYQIFVEQRKDHIDAFLMYRQDYKEKYGV